MLIVYQFAGVSVNLITIIIYDYITFLHNKMHFLPNPQYLKPVTFLPVNTLSLGPLVVQFASKPLICQSANSLKRYQVERNLNGIYLCYRCFLCFALIGINERSKHRTRVKTTITTWLKLFEQKAQKNVQYALEATQKR